jgi:hypothetical protein
MYENDLITGTDYEYNMNLDRLMQEGTVEKKIKIIIAPDNEIIGDLATVYISSNDASFLQGLEDIDHFAYMERYLDQHEGKYIQSPVIFDNADKTIDLRESFNAMANNTELPLFVKFDTDKYIAYLESRQV